MGVEGADGYGDSRAQCELRRPFGSELAGELVAGREAASEFRVYLIEKWIDGRKKSFAGQAAERCVPHPLVAHGANWTRRLGRIINSAKDRGDHVAMLESGGKTLALGWIVAQPVEQL